MKKIIRWFKNDLIYFRAITYHDGFTEKKLYINRKALTIAIIFIFGALIVWKAL